MNSLVKKLSTGKHKVIVEPRSKNLEEIMERLKNGFTHVKFIETQTDLGIDIDKNLTILNNIQFARIVGTRMLNGHKVRCVAKVDLLPRQGEGYLLLLDGTTSSPYSYPNGEKQPGRQGSKNNVYIQYLTDV